MATFSAIRTEVRRRSISDTGGSTEKTSAELAINNAQRQLQTWRRWNVLWRDTSLATVDGTKEYTLDARSVPGIMWHEEFGYTKIIPNMTTKDFIQKGLNTSTEGKPELYYINQQSPSTGTNSIVIRMWPIPDGAYTIYDSYYSAVTDMSADGDYPTFPKEFDELLIMMATYKLLNFHEKLNQAAMLRADIQDEYGRLAKWDSRTAPDFGQLLMRNRRITRQDLDGITTPIPSS